MSTYRWPRRALALFMALTALVAALLLAGGSPTRSAAASTAVSVYPIAGSQVVAPHTQIAFRGIPASQLGSITVTGSKSGEHSGKVESDSDGHGGSFIPSSGFTSGETVTVKTHLNIVDGHHGEFQYKIVTPAGAIPDTPFGPANRTRGDVWNFHSRPDLKPAAVEVTRQPHGTAHGYIFLGPEYGPLQDGPLVLDSYGRPVFFKPLPPGQMATAVRVQTYHGQSVMTWWQGHLGAGVGSGVDVINDDHYHQIATVEAANGLHADLHAFEITPQNTALIVCEYPVHFSAAEIHQTSNAVVFDSVVQEIDIPTGLVLFQWDSLDHIPLSQSYTHFPKPGHPFDYFHINSVDQDRDGNIVTSGRSTSAVYKINRSTGHVMWTLGGKHSSFKLGSGASFAFQHDAVPRLNNGLTVFDNGAGLFNAHSQSRALWLRLNFSNHTATETNQIEHAPPVLAQFEGDVQELSGGEDFVGWGQQPWFSEYNRHNQDDFDARFKDDNASFSVYRFHWNGYPQTTPAIAASNSGRTTTVWASWNGATGVKRWRVLSGSSSSSLHTATSVQPTGFETTIHISSASYVEVQALDYKGRVMSSSSAIKS